MAELIWNAVSSTLEDANGISSTDTEITVADASEFPGTGNFRIGIEDEELLVTAVAGNVFTVERGIDPSIPMAHAKGVTVSTILSKMALETYVAEQVAEVSGGAAWHFQGAWSNSVGYVIADVVEHNGSSWLNVTPNTGTEPGTNEAIWALIAAKGDQGNPGADGADGSAAAFAGASVRKSTNTSIAAGTLTYLTFNTELFDTDAFHDTGSNTGRLTVPTGKGGYYHVHFSAEWEYNATGYRFLVIRVNGATIVAICSQMGVSSGSGLTQQEVNWIGQLAAGDYVEAGVWEGAGTGLLINAVNPNSPRFTIAKIG